MESLIGELLELARIGTGRLTLHREEIDLADRVQRLVDQQMKFHLGTLITLGGVDQLLCGHWDRGWLEQVFSNLLDNAIKYSHEGDPVAVRVNTNAPGRTVSVAVDDKGIGIPPTDLAHLFERHYRDGNASLARTGLGLGLYLAAAAAGVGWGATALRLPAAAHPAAP